MTELVFDKNHALEAIRLAQTHGRDWLYENYPKPGGQMRKATTGFLMYGGKAYPVKSLGRLANELADSPMTDNPITNVFRRHFQSLGFQLIESPDDEAEDAAERQRRLAKIWERPNQARFRRSVFDLFGARCLISGCETLVALEAAHLRPVAGKGGDEVYNGIPLRADLHRLFDAGVIMLDPDTWTVAVMQSAETEYGQYHGLDLWPVISKLKFASELTSSLRARHSTGVI